MYTYIYIYINTEFLDGNQGHQEETHRPTHRFRRLFLDLLSMGWRGCASAMGAIKLPPSCSSPKIMCQSIYIIQYMQSDLCSDEDMSFMTYSELHFFLFIIAINHVKTWEKMHFSRTRRGQLFRGNSFSALGRDSCICQWQYQNGFLVHALCPVSPSRQQSPLLGLQAEALHTQINKTPGHSR